MANLSSFLLKPKTALVALMYRLLGSLFRRRGHHSLARRFFGEASALDASDTDSLFQHARASWIEGDRAHARALIDALLETDPLHAEGVNLSGALLLEEDKVDEAEALFRRALEIDATLAAPYNNLGNVYLDREDFSVAETWYRQAIARDSSNVEAWSNLGAVLNRLIRYEEAERVCRHALTLQPEHPGATNNLANALHSQGRIGEAVQRYREALRLKPGLIEAHINLSVALGDPAHLIPAIDHYLRVLERRPESFVAHIRLGQAFMAQGDYDKAETYLRKALELRPVAADAMMILANCLSGQALPNEGQDYVRQSLRLGSGMGAHTSYLFNMLYDPALGAKDIFRESREWAVLYAEIQNPPPDPRRFRNPIGQDRKLRIGYISRDFFRHSVGYFIEPIIAHHDHDRFEVFCYSNLFQGDEVTERFKQLADGWREIAFLSDEEASAMIVEDGIDILIDLSGQTSGYRPLVMARKPAPVQVNYIGYPATTGLRAIDYRIVDAITDPPGEGDAWHAEKLFRLPRCFLTYRPPADAPAVASAPAVKRGFVTFGCFNNVSKVNSEVAACWARILLEVPESRLLLKGFSFSSSKAQRFFLDMFARHGVTADRIDLVNWYPDAKGHLDFYREIDVALDPFPYNGTTTTCEALWMGVPVITYSGTRHSARVGASLLNAIGLNELVCDSLDDYVSRTARLARDTARLTELRSSLRTIMQNSSLLDGVAATRQLEDAYETMWAAWEKGQIDPTARPQTPPSTIALVLSGEERILLPDSLEVMTRYIVEEYGDWFEPETAFVRRFVQPGMHAVDIGANYGAYSLALAKLVGASGRVSAFEPAPQVAALLRQSIEANSFENVEVVEEALAECTGSVFLISRGGVELAQIAFDGKGSEEATRIPAISLDDWTKSIGSLPVAFIKIDAEGQEAAIVRGGKRFLLEQSPLVMAEYMNGHERNNEMVGEFQAAGYAAYRLVPSLNLLVPLAGGASPDTEPPPLNLFFCKADRAAAMVAEGLMADDSSEAQALGSLAAHSSDSALEHILKQPYAQAWGQEWRGWWTGPSQETRRQIDILKSVVLAHQTALSSAERYGHLKNAQRWIAEITEGSASLSLRLTNARVLSELGSSQSAACVLRNLVSDLLKGDSLAPIPFIPPLARFDRIVPRGSIFDWLLAACQEQLETVGTYSAYFTPGESLGRLRDIRDLGYGTPEISRRIDLIMRRFDNRWPDHPDPI